MPIGLASNKKLTKRFTSSGEVVVEAITTSTSWVCPVGVTEVFAILVGGGGGGGGNHCATNPGFGGGGGGGQVVTASISVIPSQSYSIVIGAGGSGATNPATTGYATSGGDTYFAKSIFSAGGGGGGGNTGNVLPDTHNYGRQGGNGGGNGSGTGRTVIDTGIKMSSSFIANAGFPGSNTGGGGAGGAPVSSTAGEGLTVQLVTPTGRFSGSLASSTFGGGGGGGTGYRPGPPPGRSYGGSGGGGNGGYWSYISSIWAHNTPAAGTINTGGGGGGAASSGVANSFNSDSGANGGSGVVYLIYERTTL